MWIRSQDREELMTVNDVYVDVYVDDYTVWASSSVRNSEDRCLGDYHSKEEAIAVLDMIQDFINGPEKVMEWVKQPDVFQMPEAGFLQNGGADSGKD